MFLVKLSANIFHVQKRNFEDFPIKDGYASIQNFWAKFCPFFGVKIAKYGQKWAKLRLTNPEYASFSGDPTVFNVYLWPLGVILVQNTYIF